MILLRPLLRFFGWLIAFTFESVFKRVEAREWVRSNIAYCLAMTAAILLSIALITVLLLLRDINRLADARGVTVETQSVALDGLSKDNAAKTQELKTLQDSYLASRTHEAALQKEVSLLRRTLTGSPPSSPPESSPSTRRSTHTQPSTPAAHRNRIDDYIQHLKETSIQTNEELGVTRKHHARGGM